MSDLYSRIEMLCEEQGITITKMCAESGANRASLTDLKMGRKQNLSAETLSKIGSYFGVSIEFLMGMTSESYLRSTEYELKKAEALYEKEKNEQKREELALAIDVLRESLSDQLLGYALMGNKKADETIDLLQTLRDEDRALLEVAKEMTPEQVRLMTEFARSLKEGANVN